MSFRISGIFVGRSTIDVVSLIEQFPRVDTKCWATEQQVIAGGPATNAAITFAYLGGRASLVTDVGSHALSSIIKDDIGACGVALFDFAPDVPHVPPISFVISVAAEGSRTIINSPRLPQSAVHLTALESLPAAPSLLLLDGHNIDAAEMVISKYPGVPVILDAGSWREAIRHIVPKVNVAIVSGQFSPPGCTGPREALNWLLERGVSSAAVTRGSRSIVAAESDGSFFELGVPVVDAVDTLGAGDVFHGAFCFYFANGSAFRESLEKASIIAAERCKSFGTRAWMT